MLELIITTTDTITTVVVGGVGVDVVVLTQCKLISTNGRCTFLNSSLKGMSITPTPMSLTLSTTTIKHIAVGAIQEATAIVRLKHANHNMQNSFLQQFATTLVAAVQAACLLITASVNQDGAGATAAVVSIQFTTTSIDCP